MPASFAARDWALLVAVALMWGSSFLLIKIGLADLAPATVAWLRLLFGAAFLALLPAARAPLRHGRDRWLVAALGLVWMAAPFLLFALAEQTISSALAGMINGAAPLFTAGVALVWFRRSPGRRLVVGLVVGFAGVLLVNVPALGAGAGVAGVVMVLLATLCYGIAFNLAEPLESRNGVLSVIWRAELVALLVLTPAGLIGLVGSAPTAGSLAAMVALGGLSTGLAFALFTLLIRRVGAARASITVYLIPVVAVLLGAGLAAEAVAPLSLAGIALVLVGAYLAAGPRRRSPQSLTPSRRRGPAAPRR